MYGISKYLNNAIFYMCSIENRALDYIEEKYNNLCEKYSYAVGTLVAILVCIAAVLVAWAVGEAICWSHGRRHFYSSIKLRSMQFKLYCKK